MKGKIIDIIYKNLWIITFVIGSSGFLYIILCLEHTNVITFAGFMFRILIFFMFILCVAFFPNKSNKSYLWLIIPIIVYVGFIGSRMDHIGYMELLAGKKDAWRQYYIMIYLILYPFILLSLIFGFRIGGGSSAKTIKIGIIGILVLFSGFLDVVYQIIYPGVVPVINTNNFFYKSIFGNFPTYRDEVIFCAAFIPLIIGILYLPLDKWIQEIFKEQV